METIEAPLGRREKRKQEIRLRIEEAAYALFKQQGIEDTSIEQICQEADVARRTFYGHFPNKHALYTRSETMLRQLMANQHTTRQRLEAMIDYIESSFAAMNAIDRQLVLVGPTAFAEDQERQREIGNSSMASFTKLIQSGVELGDVNTDFSPEMLATTVVGTLNMVTISWCLDENYPVFAKLEEARRLFDRLICKDSA